MKSVGKFNSKLTQSLIIVSLEKVLMIINRRERSQEMVEEAKIGWKIRKAIKGIEWGGKEENI